MLPGMSHTTQSRVGERTADQSAWRLHAFKSLTSVASVFVGAMMGAIVGATFGALAGLPGIWAGAVMGALAGAAAGRVMFVQEARESRHDSELDETIGVTSKNLGRRPIEPLRVRHS